MEPTLETDRLTLRPMRAEDAGELLKVFADPVVMACFDAAPFDMGQMEKWIGRNLKHQETHGYGLFSVIHKESGLLI